MPGPDWRPIAEIFGTDRPGPVDGPMAEVQAAVDWQAASVRMFAVEQAIKWLSIPEVSGDFADAVDMIMDVIHIRPQPPVVGPEIIPALLLAVQAIVSDGDGSVRQGLLDIVTKLKGDRDE